MNIYFLYTIFRKVSMLYDTRSQSEVIPQRGDYLLYEIEHGLLEYMSLDPRKRIVWHNRDNKALIVPRLDNPTVLLAIGEAIGAMFGLHATEAPQIIDANEMMRGKYWVVQFG
jgi:hypothetical protein